MKRSDQILSARLSGDIGAISAALGTALLFIPQINIINFANQTAGLRIDDFIIASLLLFGAASFIYVRRDIISQAELWILAFVVFGIVSCALNGSPYAYAIRIVEYFAFYYLGINSVGRVRLRSILITFIWWNAALITLQYFKIVGSFALGRYGMGEPVGIGSGNWEMGILLNIAWVTLAYAELCSVRTTIGLALVILGQQLVLGAREPSATFLAFFLVYLLIKGRRNSGIFLLLIPIGLIVGLATANLVAHSVASFRLAKRLSKLSTTQFTTVLSSVWRMTAAKPDFSGYAVADRVAKLYPGSDLSLLERAEKAISALKFYFASPLLTKIVGTGPGRYGVAVDEGFVRLLVENGIVGTVAFFMMLWRLFQQANMTVPLMMLFLATMTALDAYLAYKLMAMLFFVTGALSAAPYESLLNAFATKALRDEEPAH